MTEVKQICVHYLNNSCRYGEFCTKAHVKSTPELLYDIEKKGTALCTYHPNCVFSSKDCKRIHVTVRNSSDINDLISYYFKIMDLETVDKDKMDQIERVRKLIKHDLEFIKDTYECLTENS